MPPYFLVNAALCGFFCFAAIHYVAQWWWSRSERSLLAFALHCAVCAGFCPWLIALVGANTVAEAQFALDMRTSFGLVAHSTAFLVILLISKRPDRKRLGAITISIALVLALLSPAAHLNGVVTGLTDVQLPGGGQGVMPVRTPVGWWVPCFYVGIGAVYGFGICVARALWRENRLASVLIGLASAFNLFGLVVLSALIDLAGLRVPYLGATPHALFALLMAIALSREYSERGVTIHAIERRFTSAFEFAPIGMALLSPDGQWLRINLALSRILGYSPEAITTLRFQDITHPDDLETDLKHVRQLLAGEVDSYQREKRYRHADGHYIWASLSVSLVRDERGKPVHFVTQIQNITQWRQAQQDLRNSEARYRESEQQLRLALDSGHLGVWQQGLHDSRFSGDPAMFRLFGLPVPEDLSIDYADWMQCVHPEDRKRLAEELTLFPQGVTNAETSFRVIWPDGSVRHVYATGSAVLDPQGRPARVVGVARDETERLQAERERERLIHALAERVKEQSALHAAATILSREPIGQKVLADLAALLPPAFQYPEVSAARISLDGMKADTPGFREDRPLLTARFSAAQGTGSIEVVYLEERPEEDEGPFLTEERELLNSLAEMLGTAWESLRREEARRVQEARFRGMFERAAIGVALLDSEGRVVESNPALCKLLGYPKVELQAMRFAEITHPEDVEADRERFGELVRGERESYQMEKRYLRSDRSIVWGRLTVSLIPGDRGQADLAIGMVEDITESKRALEALASSEERYRSLVSASSQVVWSTDPHGGFQDDLPTWRALTGQTLEELVRPGGWLEPIHPDDRERVAVAWEEAIRTGNSYQVEYRIRAADGAYRHLNVRGVPVRDRNGKVREWVGAGTDVTERVRLQEQFHQAQKMEAIGRLAGGIAHDFNNMLAVINGFTELGLMRTTEDDPRHGFMSQVLRAGERAHALVRQLLVFSRQEVVTERRVEINLILTEMEKMLGRLIGEDLRISLALATELWDVQADAGQLEQVVMNLVVNARDAMPGGGELNIETRNVVLSSDAMYRLTPSIPPGEYVRLSVSDSGTGIDAAILPHIFEPFFTTKPAGVGTGLGLATVYGIVERFHGALGVASTLGSGTTFEVYLPRLVSGSTDLSTRETKWAAEGGSETILLVEDEAPVRDVIGQSLRALGYQVLEASGAVEAFQLSAQHPGPIDLLISDVIMPDSGGREVAERIQKERPVIRVLFVSGYNSDEFIRQGLLDGQFQLLHKPFSSTDLARKVREVLGAPGTKPL